MAEDTGGQLPPIVLERGGAVSRGPGGREIGRWENRGEGKRPFVGWIAGDRRAHDFPTRKALVQFFEGGPMMERDE